MDRFPAPARPLVARMVAAAAADPDRAVAFQGAPGANSHLAAVQAIPDCLPLPQSLGQAPAVLGSNFHRGMAFEPHVPQPPKNKHRDQQADPDPEQLGKEPVLSRLH